MGPSPAPADSPEHGQSAAVDAVVAEFLRRTAEGEALDPQQFAAQHPSLMTHLAPELEKARRIAMARREAQHGGVERVGDPSLQTSRSEQDETRPPDFPGSATSLRRVHSPVLPEDFGRYRILKQLGQGGMGTVYLAEDTELKRKVALKAPKLTEDDGPEVIERFYREARLAAALRHPNICPVYDIGQIDGALYISMAYIEGEPLSAYISAETPPSERSCATLVRTLALVLAEAHALGVIHRDLKPANVMIDPKGEPVVMDFGLARRERGDETSRLTQSGAIVGSPAYMSPEQVMGASDLGTGADVYSLGVILYELLTGDVPFRGGLSSVVAQILAHDPPRPSELRPNVDPHLEAICLRLMAKRPEDRYPTMAAAAEALTDFLKQAPPTAGRLSPVWRRPMAMIAAGFGAFLVLFGVSIVLRDGDRRIEISVDGPQAKEIAVAEREATIRTDSGVTTVRVRGPSDTGKAGTVAPSAARSSEEGEWASLFNGRDLTGWIEETPGVWSVEQGVLRCNTEKLQGLLTTTRVFSDFDLEFEYRLAPPGWHSAIYLRSGSTWGDDFASVFLLDDANPFYHQFDRRWWVNGGVHAAVGPSHNVEAPSGVWNKMLIQLVGSRLTVAVNGTQTLDADLADYPEGMAKYFDLQRRSGHIRIPAFRGANGTQGTSIELRNLRIRDRSVHDESPARGLEEILMFGGPEHGVWSVAISPDGKRIAGGPGAWSTDKDRGATKAEFAIWVWEAETGQELLRLEGHTGKVDSVNFSPDGSKILSSSRDGTVRLWNAVNGQPIRDFSGPVSDGQPVLAYRSAFSDDGKLALAGFQTHAPPTSTVRVWDVETGRDVTRRDDQSWPAGDDHASAWSVSFSPGGRFAAFGGLDGVVRIWEVQTGIRVRSAPVQRNEKTAAAVLTGQRLRLTWAARLNGGHHRAAPLCFRQSCARSGTHGIARLERL